MRAHTLLEPIKTSCGLLGFMPSTLKETRPTFQGTWVLQDPNSPVTGNKKSSVHSHKSPAINESRSGTVDAAITSSRHSLVVVQIDWTEDEEGVYEKMPPRFYKLKSGRMNPSNRMDIKLLELGT